MPSQRLSLGQHAVSGVTWPQLLAAAHSAHEVLAIARDFVASMDPDELAPLPVPCQPRKLVDADDVMAYAYELVRHHCGEHDRPAVVATVDKLSAFFSHATNRLSQLAAPAPPMREVARLFR